jgi:hypothetical protein
MCALIAPIQPVLRRISCSNETVGNAPKREFWVQWSGPGALVAKIPTQLRLANMRVSSGCSARFASTFAKWPKTSQNKSFGSNGVDRVRSLQKIPRNFD